MYLFIHFNYFPQCRQTGFELFLRWLLGLSLSLGLGLGMGMGSGWGSLWGFVSGSETATATTTTGTGTGIGSGRGSLASSAALAVSWPSQLLFWLNKLRTCRGDDGGDIELQRIE